MTTARATADEAADPDRARAALGRAVVRGAERWGLAPVLAVALALRLWRLADNGFGTDYYSAAVRSMSTGWSRFFYNAFDPGGFVSVDKPPVALWLQVLSVKLLGFHGLAVLLPQALEGVTSVWLVHHLVRRRFGSAAGLLAALFLAVTRCRWRSTDRATRTAPSSSCCCSRRGRCWRPSTRAAAAG